MMRNIEVTPEMILRYAKLNRNEIVLHLAIRSMAEDGKLKRNLYDLCRMLGISRFRLREAEFGLKRKQMLQIHYTQEGQRDVAYWYVFDKPVSEAVVSRSIVDLDDVAVEAPKPKTVWRKLRKAVIGTDLEDFSLTDDG
jgi:hypothetical protein